MPLVRSIVTFGSKRSISVQGWQRRVQIDWVWNRLGPLLCKAYGYLPAKAWRLGADNEPAQYLLDTIPWIRGKPFTDHTDGFDYASASRGLSWPPSWHLVAVNDRLLGHPQDVQAFLAETGLNTGRFTVLGKNTGYAEDYDHISMLTSAAAPEDHFVQLRDWLAAQ